MMYLRIICFLALSLATGGTTFGDTLVLSDGDNLSGTLTEINNGLVMFQSALAGKLFVLADEVKSLTTEAPFKIEFRDGEPLKGRFASKGGHVLLRLSDGSASRPISLPMIVSAKPTEEDEAEAPPASSVQDLPTLHGQLSLGYSWREGTSDESGPFIKLQVGSHGERYRFLSDSLLEITDEDSFPRLFAVLAEWQFFPEQMTRPQVSIALDRDTTNALDLRASLGVGAWRSLYRDDVQELEASAQLTADFEYYDPRELDLDADLLAIEKQWFIGQLLSGGVLGREGAFRRAFRRLTFLSYYANEQETRQEQDLGVQFDLDYERDLFRSSRFTQRLSVLPGLTDPGDLRASSFSALHFPVTHSLKLKLELQLEYEDEIEGLGIDDWRTFLGASFAWDF